MKDVFLNYLNLSSTLFYKYSLNSSCRVNYFGFIVLFTFSWNIVSSIRRFYMLITQS